MTKPQWSKEMFGRHRDPIILEGLGATYTGAVSDGRGTVYVTSYLYRILSDHGGLEPDGRLNFHGRCLIASLEL